VVGFDQDGREVLSWVAGEAPGHPWPIWMQSGEVLAELGRLLRRFHVASASFAAPPGSSWRCWLGSPGGPMIRHGDLWPANFVFRSGKPVALVDWDFAQPGTVLDDLASAAKHWVPLCSDERAAGDGWQLPLERRRRLRVLCDGYGLDRTGREALVPTVLRNALFGYLSHKTWGESGVPGFAEMWRDGSGKSILNDRAWLQDHLDLCGFVDD